MAAELFHAGRRTDLTKLRVAIRNFPNAPKKTLSSYRAVNSKKTGNVRITLWRVRITNFAVEKNEVFHILCLCVSVALIIQHAMRMRRRIFEKKKVLKAKCVF